MNMPFKALLSFLITAGLLSVFAALYWIDFFGGIEAEFYAPSIHKTVKKKLSAETSAIERYFNTLDQQFSDILAEGPVNRTFAIQQNEIDIYERSRLFGELLNTLPALQWVRLIDSGGNRIHFSTESADLVIRSGNTAAYRMWTEVPRYVRLTPAMTSGSAGILFDGENDRFIYYIPCYDTQNIRRGLALFALSSRALSDEFFAGGWTALNESVTLITEPRGIITGLREEADGALKTAIANMWKDNAPERARVRSERASFFLFTEKTAQNIFVGVLADETLFMLPAILKILIGAMIAATLYILVFWFMNIKQDPVTVVQHRLKHLQISLLNEYFDLKDDMDWRHWKRDLARRREETRRELLRGFTEKKNHGVYRYVNSFFDKSWDELVAVISSRSKSGMEQLDEEQFENMLNRIVRAAVTIAENQKPGGEAEPSASHAQNRDSSSVPAPVKPASVKIVNSAEDVEELEELNELEAAGLSRAALPHAPVPVKSAPVSAEDAADIEELEELEAVEIADSENAGAARVPDSKINEIQDIESELLEELEELENEELDEAQSFEENAIAKEPAALTNEPVDEAASEGQDVFVREENVDTIKEEIKNKVIQKISASILQEVLKTTRIEQAKQARKELAEQKTKSELALRNMRILPKKSEDTADYPPMELLEQDTFTGVDCEESEESLNSDDFSYGSFIVQPAAFSAAKFKPKAAGKPAAAPPRPAAAAVKPMPRPAVPPQTTASRTPPASIPPKPAADPLKPAVIPSKPEAASPEFTVVPYEPQLVDPTPAKPSAPVPPGVPAFTVGTDGLLSFDDDTPDIPHGRAAAQTAPESSTSDAYTVESFESVSTDELQRKTQQVASPVKMSFESPHRGSDVNKIAMRIEFAPEKENAWDHDFDMDMIVTSPLDTLFSSEEKASPVSVISEYAGVPYINAMPDARDKNGDVDPKIKNLVDSVLTPSLDRS